MHPLHWPEWWTRQGGWNRFLLGVPLLGPQDACQHALCWQLRQRDESCLEAWAGSRRPVARCVSGILHHHLHWPHDLFVPDDPLDILVWDCSAYLIDDLNVGAAVLDIERQLGIELNDEEWEAALRTWTLGELVDEILRRKQSTR